jgi:protein-L-isoaspartate(D-aspartate) O-methyltransferase
MRSGAPKYRETPDADPRHIYHDVLVAIDPARVLNNGQPSALAKWLAALELVPGERVMHVGAGVGYYTAIIAEVVGSRGRVVGVEIDPDLAERARTNLAAYPWVALETGDASAPAERFDAIFINAGCTYARREWLDALDPGGRILLPLTLHMPQFSGGVGGMLRADRKDGEWAAKFVSQVGIYDCANARDPAHEAELKKLFSPDVAPKITTLDTSTHERRENCVIHIDGFCLR